MHRRIVATILVSAAAVAFGVAVARAESACRANCDAFLSTCKSQCAVAPVADECEANCRLAYPQCLADCGLTPTTTTTTKPTPNGPAS